MAQRGRVSAAAHEVAALVTATIPRPDAPYDLTDEESAEWWAVVNRMPAEWFPRETHGMLAQYCRHVVVSNKLAQLRHKLEVSKNFSLHEYDLLLKMQERESRIIASLATKMRISQQSTYDQSKKKPITLGRPWDED